MDFQRKDAWLGERGLDPFQHKKKLKKLKRKKWWEITDRQRKLMEPVRASLACLAAAIGIGATV